MSESENYLNCFFKTILEKIEKNELSTEERFCIMQFIIDFTALNSEVNSKTNSKLKISPSLFQIITAGTLFYNTISNGEIDYSKLEADNEVIIERKNE
jgi:hypothetical protein